MREWERMGLRMQPCLTHDQRPTAARSHACLQQCPNNKHMPGGEKSASRHVRETLSWPLNQVSALGKATE